VKRMDPSRSARTGINSPAGDRNAAFFTSVGVAWLEISVQTIMRFLRRTSFVELLFEKEDDALGSLQSDNARNGRSVLSRSSSTHSISDAPTLLTQDPMHEPTPSGSPKSTCSHLSLRSINELALSCLEIGDRTVDDESVEWSVRQCFCKSTECCGKTFKRVEGKDELDVWDRGRPRHLG
jgi:hypothetical protein